MLKQVSEKQNNMIYTSREAYQRAKLRASQIINIVLAIVLIFVVIQYRSLMSKCNIVQVVYTQEDSLLTTIGYDYIENDWLLFTHALIEHESNGNDSAVGKADDVGCLQITPIYVQECNRIVGYDKYSLDDRYDRAKSIEMFNVINDAYNKQHDLHLAMKLHNPRASIKYHDDVLKIYNRKLEERKHKSQNK